MTDAPSAFDQASYQIRFDWGARAVRTLAPSHITVVVDALPGESSSTSRASRGTWCAPASSIAPPSPAGCSSASTRTAAAPA
ncbi:hypothetical protein Q0F99_03010 [Rathayibacter oskolensis]|uniref:hypothetical protein n=1 Tax=Rathayibacter oskolensis TaxID=1891671 RepID=UPI00265EF89E|nr:hypothetical protein [Rathayibacter oskolensis]WKK72058.1 hypothetical protein Q0F99_03010 [Rathayibacter oskolensis]